MADTVKKTTTTKSTTAKASPAKATTAKPAAKAPAAKTTAPKAAAPKAEAKPAEEAKPVEEVKPVEETVVSEPKASKAPAKKAAPKEEVYIPRVRVQYEKDVKPALMEKYHYKSVMELPKLNKIVINWGVGDAVQDAKHLEDAVNELTLIAGQKPVVTRAKHSISSFKLREGQAIGCKVTLRGTRMYEFYDKLVSLALPRVRDFRGVSKNAFDGRGNYTLGVREQLIFPEIDYDKVHKVRGMDIVIVTTAKTDEEAYTLLSLLGMPFAK